MIQLLFLFILLGQVVDSFVESKTDPFNLIQDITPINIDIHVFLEGAMSGDEWMHTRLYDRGYLPGQRPKTFFGKATKAGQPYNRAPWHYRGREDNALKKSFQYPSSTVDWVLVSLVDDSESMNIVCQYSGLLLADGQIRIVDESGDCNLNTKRKYYVMVEHRNHLGVISHMPVAVIDNRLSFDFRSQDPYNARQSGAKVLKNGIVVMAAGNGDQHSTTMASYVIDEHDLSLWRKENGLNSKYLRMDLDLSGDVTVKDQELLFKNYGVMASIALPK